MVRADVYNAALTCVTTFTHTTGAVFFFSLSFKARRRRAGVGHHSRSISLYCYTTNYDSAVDLPVSADFMKVKSKSEKTPNQTKRLT
jgi:hypothetical protein